MAIIPPFLTIPPEIRILIYQYLLGTDGQEIVVRNVPRSEAAKLDFKCNRRSRYHVLERTFSPSSYETTYYQQTPHKLYPAILGVNRAIREEASHFLYSTRSFDFGNDLGAVVPFFEDKTDATRGLVSNITIHKKAFTGMSGCNSHDWAAICRYLRVVPGIRRLKLVVEAGRPRFHWPGPQTLSVSDLRLLYATQHEVLGWVRDLAQLTTIDHIEVVADLQPMREPTTSQMLIFAALSGSIETSLVDFLRDEMKLAISSSLNVMTTDINGQFVDRGWQVL